MPSKKEDLPDTLERSPAKVQRAYEETLDSAHDQYGDEEALRIRGSKTWRLLEEKISREKK